MKPHLMEAGIRVSFKWIQEWVGWVGTVILMNSLVALTFFWIPSSDAATWSVDEFLKVATEKNSEWKAIQVQKEAIRLKADLGDLRELSPFLQLKAGYLKDQRETTLPAQYGTETRVRQYSLGVSKKFFTGTTLSLGWENQSTEIEGILLPLPIWNHQLALGVSQNLWKDFFGRGTRLRREREALQAEIQLLKASYDERRILSSAEAAYWDWALQVLSLQERNAALERARKILGWTERRLKNGIGDPVDVLQVKSLIAVRQLALVTTEDALVAARKGLSDWTGVELSQLEQAEATMSQSILNLEKAPTAATTGGHRWTRLDHEIQNRVEQVSELSAREMTDSLRPDLQFKFNAGFNGRDDDSADGFEEMWKLDTPFYQVSLEWTVNLDFWQTHRLTRSVELEAGAEKLKSDRARLSLLESWEELQRRVDGIGKVIHTMRELEQAQLLQFEREQQRLSLGKTTTFQVINVEQELADTRFRYLEMQIQQRKLMASSRFFIEQDQREAL